MSNENRRYVKRKRAEAEAETRSRIAEAAMHLHGSVGPARTTISAVADAAGVRRATVYRHFPDETSLFRACSAHWLATNPLPALAPLREIADPGDRLAAALTALYGFYRRTERMLTNVYRDAPVVPAMAPAVAQLRGWSDDFEDLLISAYAETGRDNALLHASIRHATAFATWRTLCIELELSDDDARRLMQALVAWAAARTGD